MRNKAGFTLIEIMVSLVLVGLIASVAGTSVLMGLRGYINTRENNEITQKAQLAMNRINREFIELIDIRDIVESPACLIYEGPGGRRALKYDQANQRVLLLSGVTAMDCSGLAGGDTLVDNVQTFIIMYNPSSGMSLWGMGQDIRNLFAVTVQLVLNRPDTGGGVSFLTTVSPRNNNNAGGAAVPTPDNLPPDYAGKTCFVATAAWGDRDHPVVELLREFRDRVLAKTSVGAAFVRFYYRVGPTMAGAIEGNPLACLAARLLISPLAGLAFFALYFPALIPLVLVLSWGGARLILSRPRGRIFRRSAGPRGQRGAILVTLIAAMVVFSALTAVMLSMFGSASLGQAASNNVMRAYYLAESGFRYAASEYVNAADETTREIRMKAMHNQEYQLAANSGKFQLMVYPYYYRVQEISPVNPRWLNTKVTGGYPLSSANYVDPSWIRIQKVDGSVSYEQILGASLIFPDTVQFTKKNGDWSGIAAGAEVTPACVPNSSAGLALSDHGNITIVKNSGADAFPQRNGTFTVKIQGETKPRILRYRELDLVSDPPKLKDVYDPNGTTITGKSMVDPGAGVPNNFVSLSKFVKVESIGTFGQGSQTVSRKVTYETPIGYLTLTAPKTEVQEQFSSGLQNWFTGSEVSHIGTQIVVGGAMKLTGERTTNVAPASACLLFRENQIALDWRKAFSASGKQENFETEWRRAGRYLSYDVQTKLFLDSTNQIYAGGVSFRLDEAGNSLGFTILSSISGIYSTNGCDRDGIPDGMTGIGNIIQNNPYLILWMKEAARTEQNFSTALSPHQDPSSVTYPPPLGTGTRAILIGACSFWQTGTRVRFNNSGGSLPGGISEVDYFIRVITDSGIRYVYLFDTYEHAVGLDTVLPWQGLRDITTAGSGTSNMVAQDPQWTKLVQKALNLFPNVGDVYRILKSEGGGLYIRFRDWTSLTVRIIEAPSLSFKNGGGAGLEIVSGNIVYQTQDDTAGGTVTAIGQVRNDPVYWNRYDVQPAEWNWEAGTAAGVLMLEVLKDEGGNIRPYTFTSGKKLYVGDHPSGTWMATAGIPSTVTDESIPMRNRDNWIQVFVGDKDGPDNPNGNPFDTFRALSPRDQIFWSPDRVGYPGITTPSNDRFSLVLMSDYRNECFARRFPSKQNTETDTRGDFIRLGKAQYDGSTFYSTPTTGTTFPSSRPEIGLHAYGPADSITNLYYDDFAVRFGPVGGVRSGFLLPVQR